MAHGFFIEVLMPIIIFGVGTICTMFINKFDTDGGVINLILALATLCLLFVIMYFYQAIPR